jgi:DNA-binding PadR family transcriptional regulator
MKKYLTRADEILLLSVYRLQDEAYGVTIRKDVLERTGKKLSFGALWVSLDNLSKRGYLAKSQADASPTRGGRGKLYYRLTPAGLAALQRVRDLQQSLWEGIPPLGIRLT